MPKLTPLVARTAEVRFRSCLGAARRSSVAPLLFILVLAFLVRVWGTGNGLPHAQLPEETNEIRRSLQIATGKTPTYTFHRVAWPLTQIAVHAAYLASLKLRDPQPGLGNLQKFYFTRRGAFVRHARTLSAVVGTFSLVPLWFVARRMGMNRTFALLATAMAAFHPAHVYLSHFGHPNAYATLWVNLGLMAAVEITRSPRTRIYAVAGVSFALATLTRLDASLLGVAILSAHFIAARSHPDESPWRGLLRGFIPAFIGSALLANPFIILAPGAVVADLRFIVQEHYGTAPGPIIRLGYAAQNLAFPLILLRPYILFPSCLGAAVGIRQRNAAVGVLSVFCASMGVALLTASHPRIYYWLPASGPAAILAGYAAAQLAAQRRPVSRTLGWAAIWLMTVAGVTESLVIDSVLARRDTRIAAYDFVTTTVPEDSGILVGDPFVFSVPLMRSAESIERLDGALRAATYEFFLQNPTELKQPRYDLYGLEWRSDIKSDEDFRRFIRGNSIEYVVEASYCQGVGGYEDDRTFSFPYISPVIAEELDLIASFSPFRRDAQTCVRYIGECFHLERFGLAYWARSGPLIRVFRVKGDVPQQRPRTDDDPDAGTDRPEMCGASDSGNRSASH